MTIFLLSVVAFTLIIAGAMVYLFRELRDLRRLPRRDPAVHPYRAPFHPAGADPGEAWQAGVAAERARVLMLVGVAHGACSGDRERSVVESIRKGVEGGTVGK